MNIFSFTVFSRTFISKSTTSLLLRILSVSDIFTLYSSLLQRWLRLQTGWYLEVSSDLSCGIYYYFNHLAAFMSNWTLVIITLERVLAITHPHKVTSICTKFRASITLFCIFVCLCLMNIPILKGMKPTYFFVFDSDDTTFILYIESFYCCAMNDAYVSFMVFLVDNLIPFLVILCSNIIILASLALARQNHKKMMEANTKQTDDSQLNGQHTLN